MRCAFAEKTAKFTPKPSQVEPNGYGAPGSSLSGSTCGMASVPVVLWFWRRRSMFWTLRWGCAGQAVRIACVCAGIRDLLACFRRRPCAGRHLLFFAAAKKSRQKKAAHTANPCSCLRALKGSYASHGNHVTDVRCQRSRSAPHPRHAPAVRRTVPDSPRPPRWQTVCRPKCSTRHTSDPEAHGVLPRKSATLYDGTTYTQFAAIGLKTFAKINS